MRWSGADKAPTVTRKPCRKCGQEVDAFTDPDVGLTRQLDTDPVPINWDIQHLSLRRRLWEYGGKNIGWYQLWRGRRTWRELRLAHQCENTSASNSASASKREESES